jgi:hypothetical protein
MSEIDVFFVAKQDGSFDHMAQFSNVPWPRVSFQGVKRPGRDSFNNPTDAEVNLTDEITG